MAPATWNWIPLMADLRTCVFFGPLVQLKLVVKETGKLNGRFVIGMDLQPDAARELAATLAKLADVAQNSKV